MLLQELKDNFATWNLNQSFAILDDKIVLISLTRFLSDVEEVSSPTAKKTKKDDLLNSLGESFPFYQEITVPDVDKEATPSLPPGPSRPIKSSSLKFSNYIRSELSYSKIIFILHFSFYLTTLFRAEETPVSSTSIYIIQIHCLS